MGKAPKPKGVCEKVSSLLCIRLDKAEIQLKKILLSILVLIAMASGQAISGHVKITGETSLYFAIKFTFKGGYNNQVDSGYACKSAIVGTGLDKTDTPHVYEYFCPIPYEIFHVVGKRAFWTGQIIARGWSGVTPRDSDNLDCWNVLTILDSIYPENTYPTYKYVTLESRSDMEKVINWVGTVAKAPLVHTTIIQTKTSKPICNNVSRYNYSLLGRRLLLTGKLAQFHKLVLNGKFGR